MPRDAAESAPCPGRARGGTLPSVALQVKSKPALAAELYHLGTQSRGEGDHEVVVCSSPPGPKAGPDGPDLLGALSSNITLSESIF